MLSERPDRVVQEISYNFDYFGMSWGRIEKEEDVVLHDAQNKRIRTMLLQRVSAVYVLYLNYFLKEASFKHTKQGFFSAKGFDSVSVGLCVRFCYVHMYIILN